MSDIFRSPLTADPNVGRPFPRPPTLQDVHALFPPSTALYSALVLPSFSSQPTQLKTQPVSPLNISLFLTSQYCWLRCREFDPEKSDWFEEIPQIDDLQETVRGLTGAGNYGRK